VNEKQFKVGLSVFCKVNQETGLTTQRKRVVPRNKKSRCLNKEAKKDESCIFFVIDPMSTFKGPFRQAEAASRFEKRFIV
jgi:hypothetical protein